MIWAFTELTKYLKIRGINLGLHFMDNEVSTDLKMKMTTMDIKYQLVPLSNHRAKNTERSIKAFKNHFIVGLYSVDKASYLQLWDRLIQQTTISINVLRQSRIASPLIILHPHIWKI